MLTSIKMLLTSIVDYAGLFPPAKLTLREAMANYEQHQASPYRWMLDRFVLPASQLEEFLALQSTSPSAKRLSVILSGDLESAIEHIRPLSEANLINMLEIPPLAPAEIERVYSHFPTETNLFFEIPFDVDLDDSLPVLQKVKGFAKIRTGGITENAFPSVDQLGQTIFAFAEAGIPFKATAGLHHPLPAKYPITYEPESPSTLMHGFLNVAIAAAFAYWKKVTLQEVLEMLRASSIEDFQFSEDKIVWREQHLDIQEIEQSRKQFFRSFGSCSFHEPINDLQKLYLL